METLANSTLEEIWQAIETKLTENPEPYSEMKGIYGIQITDEEVNYEIKFDKGNFAITSNVSEEADCTLKMKSSVFRKFLAGNLNSMTAFMTGKLKVDGNIGLALKLENMLKKYEF